MIRNKIKKYITNKKGDTTISFVLSVILIFWIILFMIDIYKITSIYIEATSMMRVASETISSQGGLEETAPTDYPNPSKYVTRSALRQYVNDTMLDIGVTKGDFTIKGKNALNNDKVESKVLNKSQMNMRIDYGDEITVTLRYAVDFTSLPMFDEKQVFFKTISRKTFSQYKHRNSGWESDDPNV